MESKHIVGIEIGSSKIKAAVGKVDRDRSLTVVAVEETPILDSVRYGVICNVEIVATALAGILRRLEERLHPRKVESVYVAVGGQSLATRVIEVGRQLPDEMEITASLVEQLRSEALNTRIDGKDIVGMTTRSFMIDKKATEHPEGMFGHSIRAEFNLITCRVQNKRNIKRVITDKLGLDINAYIVRQIAQADVVLSDEEKRQGCVLVDFGAETTTVSVYRRGKLQYIATLPMGSRNITKDLMSIHHLEEKAEEIKRIGGSAIPQNSSENKSGIDFTESNNYVAARAGEIIANIRAQIEYAGFKAADLPSGIVIIGNGAKLREFNSRLETVCGMKVRRGFPSGMVRISDSRIQPSDSVDIIGVLAAASQLQNVVECMPEPQPEPEPVKEEVVLEPEKVVVVNEEPVVENPHMTGKDDFTEDDDTEKQRNSWFRRTLDRVASAMRGMEEDDEFSDDED